MTTTHPSPVSSTVNLTAATRIGDAAAAHADLIPVFERFGLDYCCRGGDSIEQSCARAGTPIGDVMQAVSEALTAKPGASVSAPRSMSEQCDDIERTHHAFVRDAFSRLDTLLPRVLAAHGAAHPELVELRAVVAELKAEMLDHMVREERVLFPWLRRLENPHSLAVGPPWSVKRPIDCMVHDHDAVGTALARIRALTGGYRAPDGACASYVALFRLLHDLERDTHLHVHKENNVLFPAGVRAEASRRSNMPPATTEN